MANPNEQETKPLDMKVPASMYRQLVHLARYSNYGANPTGVAQTLIHERLAQLGGAELGKTIPPFEMAPLRDAPESA